MMQKISKKQFAFGAAWKITEQLSAKGISFVVTFILARMLTPGDYGIIAITAIFTNLSDVLIDGGFSTALIRKKEVDKYDYSCVFAASIITACILYLLIFWGAPTLASYYGESRLTSVLRVIALVLFVQAFSSVRNALVHRNMQFKLLFYCNLAGSFLSGCIGIAAAVAGYGVWALVLQQLSQQVAANSFLFLKLHWKLEWHMKWDRLKGILRFSISVMGAGLLNYAGSSIYSLLIGKRYSVTDLGYSDKGAQLPMQVSLYTFSAMSSVLLPTLSSYQDDRESFKKILRKVVHMTAYLVFPMMVGMAVAARELIVVLLTDRWLPALKILQFSCIYYIATPFMLVNIQAFYAIGHSSIRVKTEAIRLVFMVCGFGIFSLGFHCSVNGLAAVSAIIAVLTTGMTYFELKKLVAYSLREAAGDLCKPCVSAIVMGIFAMGFHTVLQTAGVASELLILIATVGMGALVYLLLSVVWNIDAFLEIQQMVRVWKK